MAFVGNVFFERGNGGTPEVYTRVCQVFNISGVGQTNELVDSTTFCSNGSREYIGGLADGEEFTVEANYEVGVAQLSAMITDVTNKATRAIRLVVDSGSPSQFITFSAAALGWTINPAVEDRNTITFTFKISGAITIV